MHAAERHKLQSLLAASQSTVSELRAQLSRVEGQLGEQSEALAAAQRLSEQLERKDEAMVSLRDEGMIYCGQWFVFSSGAGMTLGAGGATMLLLPCPVVMCMLMAYCWFYLAAISIRTTIGIFICVISFY